MPTEASESSKELDDAILKALQRRSVAGASSEESDEALISSIVGAHLHSVERASGKLSTLWIASAGLLAAAAAAALWVIPAGSGSEHVELTTAASTEVAPTQAMWLLEPDQTPLEGVVVASDQTCGLWGDTRSCLQPEGRARFGKDGSLTLESGMLEVTAKHALVVLIDDIRVEVSELGSTFTATQHDQAWEVEVEAGQLSVFGPGEQVRVLEAGQSARSEEPKSEPVPVELAEPSAPERAADSEAKPSATKPAAAPAPSADELLARARSQRAAKEYEAAAKSYEQLVRAHGGSAKARAALVSLAQLYQGPLSDPAKALTHFERYLERGGPLSEEAHYGKIRALRSLGRDASAEIDAFLAAYPDTTHADALRAQ